MARGYPDWGLNPATLSYFVDDDAELAVRLGSPYVYERLGNVLALDLNGVQLDQWEEALSGTDAAIVDDTTVVFTGDTSIKLTPGSSISYYASIFRQIPFVGARNVGVSLMFAAREAGCEMRVDLKHYIGGMAYEFNFSVTAAGLVRYWTGSAWVTVFDTGNSIYDATRPFWQLLHCSVNLTDLQYKAVQFNHVKEALTATYSGSGITAWPDGLEVRITAFDETGDQDVTYVDAIVIVVDEP